MIKYVIFDMDGVLVNSMPAHIKAWIKAFKKVGIKAKKEELSLLEGANYHQHFDYFEKKTKIKIDKATRKEIHNLKLEFFNDFKIKVYQVQKDIYKLKGLGMRCAVASGSMRAIVDEIIQKFFEGVFDCVITGDDVVNAKPDPEIYEKAVRCLNAKKAETLVIENAPLGIASAKDAGLKVLAIATTLKKNHLSGADLVFPNHKKLFSYLFRQLLHKTSQVRR